MLLLLLLVLLLLLLLVLFLLPRRILDVRTNSTGATTQALMLPEMTPLPKTLVTVRWLSKRYRIDNVFVLKIIDL